MSHYRYVLCLNSILTAGIKYVSYFSRDHTKLLIHCRIMFACRNVYKLLQAQLCFKNNSTTSTPYINTFSDIYLRYLIINKRVFNLNIQYIIQNILI